MEKNVVRLIDLGEVPFLRSQTVYHAVAKAMGDSSPDTIILSTPREPYACIGYHQDLRREIDLDFCGEQGLPVLRREIGGGTVYLDGNQLFYHTVFHRRRAPRRVDDIYHVYLRGPIETYHQLGIAARLEPPNDILVDDRKIGGTGAGSIGDAVVVSGSIIFDFDCERMAGLLRAPSHEFRGQVERQLKRYMTSLRGELHSRVSRRHVRDLLISQFAKTLGVEIRGGKLTAEEWAQVEELDYLFLQREWLDSIERQSPIRRVKIRSGVMVCEAESLLDGCVARLTLSAANGYVAEVEVGGELGLANGQRQHLESLLLGLPLQAMALQAMALSAALGPVASEIEERTIVAIHSCLSKIAQELGNGG